MSKSFTITLSDQEKDRWGDWNWRRLIWKSIPIGCCCLAAQSCLTDCDPMDSSPPVSSVCGVSQAKIQEQVAISFSRESSRPRDWTCFSCIGRQVLYHWPTREALPFAWGMETSSPSQLASSTNYITFSPVLIVHFHIRLPTLTLLSPSGSIYLLHGNGTSDSASPWPNISALHSES